MKDWLIRKLGGYPAPEKGHSLFIRSIPGGYETVGCVGGREDMIGTLGGVSLPQTGEGQYLRGPTIRRDGFNEYTQYC